jgi:hypothetical protein
MTVEKIKKLNQLIELMEEYGYEVKEDEEGNIDFLFPEYMRASGNINNENLVFVKYLNETVENSHGKEVNIIIHKDIITTRTDNWQVHSLEPKILCCRDSNWSTMIESEHSIEFVQLHLDFVNKFYKEYVEMVKKFNINEL